MPELPEVETVVRDLRPHLVGRTIVNAKVYWRKMIDTPSATGFTRGVRGNKILQITRRGKYLIFHLSSRKFMLVHLRMTGGFHLDSPKTPRDKHMHVVFQMSDGYELRFRDTRKFGRMWLVDDPELVIGKLGPEAPDIATQEFHTLFEKRRGYLKPLLLDQTFLAGLGNIYVDESLWYARLHPLRRAETLTREERTRLHRAIHQVLKRAIAMGGTSIDVMYKRVNGASGGFQNSLRAFDREERPCRRCGTLIVKDIVGQRGTHFCPTCQRK